MAVVEPRLWIINSDARLYVEDKRKQNIQLRFHAFTFNGPFHLGVGLLQKLACLSIKQTANTYIKLCWYLSKYSILFPVIEKRKLDKSIKSK